MANKQGVNTQNIFLNCLRTSKTTVTVFLSNGTKLYGVVIGYDEFTIVLECKDSQTLVYKSNISSIQPNKALKPIKKDDTQVKSKTM